MNLLHALADVVERHPERPFLRQVMGSQTCTLTYGELLQRAWRFRDRLAEAGVRRGDVVLIVLRHCPEQYSAFLGAMLLGAVPSFMPFKTPKQDAALYWTSHRELFQRIGARVLLTWRLNLAELTAALGDSAPPAIAVDDDAVPGGPALAEALAQTRALDPGEGDVAFLQHSSGTTGSKKGVMLAHAPVLRQVSAYRAAIGLEPDDVIASWLPLYHDMGLLACFVLPMVTGNTVVALDPFEWVGRPTLLLEQIECHRAAFAWLPNFAFLHLARYAPAGDRWDLSSLRAVMNCSEPCKPAAFERFLERFGGSGVRRATLQVCYAMAETVFAVTQTPPGRAVRSLTIDPVALGTSGHVVEAATGSDLLSCGVPIGGAEIQILDAGGAPLPEDRAGEIAICAEFLFDGYYRLPEVTARKLRDGWLRTGDMGFRHQGELYVLGRKDDMLIVCGQNFYAHEVEACVNATPGVIPGRCVALARYNEARGSQDAVVIVEPQPGTDTAQLQRDVKRRVLEAMALTLAEVVTVPRGWLVKTTSGKISRSENATRLAAKER